MNLTELVQNHPRPASAGVPAWLLGHYRRRSITFADGTTDRATHVSWLQSRNFSIDLRLSPEDDDLPPDLDSPTALRRLANREGWAAPSRWDGMALSWRDPVSLQLHDRWPEPAQLRRVGNCLIEFAPSGAYVEEWRLQPSAQGPLIGLWLLEEHELADGRLCHAGGGLIVCGEHAAIVRGRPRPIASGRMLRDEAIAALGDSVRLHELFDIEVSVGRGDASAGFKVTASTTPGRVGLPLLPTTGFDAPTADGRVRQRFDSRGESRERWFQIDTLEPGYHFDSTTPVEGAAQAWLQQETETLHRHASAIA